MTKARELTITPEPNEEDRKVIEATVDKLLRRRAETHRGADLRGTDKRNTFSPDPKVGPQPQSNNSSNRREL